MAALEKYRSKPIYRQAEIQIPEKQIEYWKGVWMDLHQLVFGINTYFNK